MTGVPSLQTAGDLEAVLLAETVDLLARLIGPYMYTVVGTLGQQQASFASSEVEELFYIRVHELLAPIQRIPRSLADSRHFSLLVGGGWLANRHVDRRGSRDLLSAQQQTLAWFSRPHRVVFWASEIGRHLRLQVSMAELIAMRANLAKHHLLRLDRELRRLQKKCFDSNCPLSDAETVAARSDYEAHIRGMLQYHATSSAEHIGWYLLGLYKFVKARYEETTTDISKDIAPVSPVSDPLFHYMYASSVRQLAGWHESRIVGSIPTTSWAFQGPYPQHADWEVIESERNNA